MDCFMKLCMNRHKKDYHLNHGKYGLMIVVLNKMVYLDNLMIADEATYIQTKVIE